MPERHTVQLPAGELSYLESGQGVPIVFLHAMGRSASDWLPVIEALESDWRCIALDQRGHGDSVRPGEYTYELLEQDFRHFVDLLGLERFVLVAHSMGGMVGWIFAEQTPDRVDALIIEDTPVPSTSMDTPEVPASPPEPVAYDWEVRRQLYQQLNKPDPSWWEDLPRVTSPTLIFVGSDDHDLAETARILPQADSVTIDVGHWIHETVPDLFIHEIRAFLHRNSSPS